MAIGELYELIDKQFFLGQEVRNVYHYVNRRESGSAQALAEAWAAQVLPSLLNCQHPSLEHYEIECINLDDDNDFGAHGISAVGDNPIPGEAMPSFVAARVKLIRGSRSVRNGAKRIAGPNEGGVSGNLLTADYLADVQAFADELVNPVISVQAGEWDLVIFGRPTPNRPSRVLVDVIDASAQIQVSTQNTRKGWVGN